MPWLIGIIAGLIVLGGVKLIEWCVNKWFDKQLKKEKKMWKVNSDGISITDGGNE